MKNDKYEHKKDSNEHLTAENNINTRLPTEALMHIFSFLPTTTKASVVTRVCKKWREIINISQLWQDECDKAEIAIANGQDKKKAYEDKLKELAEMTSVYIFYKEFDKNKIGSQIQLEGGTTLCFSMQDAITEAKEHYDGEDIPIFKGAIIIPIEKIDSGFIYEVKMKHEQIDELRRDEVIYDFLSDNTGLPLYVLNAVLKKGYIFPTVPLFSVHQVNKLENGEFLPTDYGHGYKL